MPDPEVRVTGVRTAPRQENRLVDRPYVCNLLSLSIGQLKANEIALGLVPPVKVYVNKRTVRYHLQALRTVLSERGLLNTTELPQS